MDQTEFFQRQQEAVSRMMEMNARSRGASSGKEMPPVPDFLRVSQTNSRGERSSDSHRRSPAPERSAPSRSSAPSGRPAPRPESESSLPSLTAGLGIPFLDSLKTDSDISLILGLLLLFFSESTDRLLLLALVYLLL